jgi:hypothetical protein
VRLQVRGRCECLEQAAMTRHDFDTHVSGAANVAHSLAFLSIDSSQLNVFAKLCCSCCIASHCQGCSMVCIGV